MMSWTILIMMFGGIPATILSIIYAFRKDKKQNRQSEKQ